MAAISCQFLFSRALDRQPAASAGGRRGRLIQCCSSPALPEIAKRTKGWKSFSRYVSGEWSGCAADFDSKGKPVELPCSLVPHEYNEWGVKLFDWETYCATQADEKNKKQKFYNKTLRLYPTVGCGSTTVTIYKTEEQTVEEDREGDQDDVLAFHPSGSYVAVWKKQKLVEHCLVDERQEGLRIRILHQLKEFGSSGLLLITIYKEQWEEDFQSGKTVESCLTRHSGLSVGRRLYPGDLRGTWQTVKFSSASSDGCGCINKLELEKSGTDVLERQNLDGFVLLPEGLWSSVKQLGEEIEVEAGWLINPGMAVASRCKLSSSSGKLEKLELETQYRDSRIRKTYRTAYLDDGEDPLYSSG